jgi:hypothetical protein
MAHQRIPLSTPHKLTGGNTEIDIAIGGKNMEVCAQSSIAMQIAYFKQIRTAFSGTCDATGAVKDYPAMIAFNLFALKRITFLYLSIWIIPMLYS